MLPAPSGGETVVRAQWDIALRDLDFVLGLDANGDGAITWRELRERQEALARYAYGFLSASADGKPCTLRPARQRVANHADGAYAALSFDIVCPGGSAKLKLDYRAFFALDPSHRCILVMRSRGEAATALLSPQNDVGRPADLAPVSAGRPPRDRWLIPQAFRVHLPGVVARIAGAIRANCLPTARMKTAPNHHCILLGLLSAGARRGRAEGRADRGQRSL